MSECDLGPAEVVVNDVRYVRKATLFAAMDRVEELQAEVARKTPPHPDAVPQWGCDDWREWARRSRTENSQPNPVNPATRRARMSSASAPWFTALRQEIADRRARRVEFINAPSRTMDALLDLADAARDLLDAEDASEMGYEVVHDRFEECVERIAAAANSQASTLSRSPECEDA